MLFRSRLQAVDPSSLSGPAFGSFSQGTLCIRLRAGLRDGGWGNSEAKPSISEELSEAVKESELLAGVVSGEQIDRPAATRSGKELIRINGSSGGEFGSPSRSALVHRLDAGKGSFGPISAAWQSMMSAKDPEPLIWYSLARRWARSSP